MIDGSPWPTRYLGDGVTASFDGYQLWLKTPRGFNEHCIALEPEALGNLLLYLKSLGPSVLMHFRMSPHLELHEVP